MNWRDYPRYSQNIERAFVWGVLVTGVYGVYQYIVAPEWDRLWLVETKLYTSMGNPEPLGMRVWSIMNSPLHFATVSIAGLMLLFTNQGFLRLSASVFGYLAFMLTTVCTAWGGGFVAFITFTTSLKPRLQMRLIPHSADIQAEVKEDRFGNNKLPNDCTAIVWEFIVV